MKDVDNLLIENADVPRMVKKGAIYGAIVGSLLVAVQTGMSYYFRSRGIDAAPEYLDPNQAVSLVGASVGAFAMLGAVGALRENGLITRHAEEGVEMLEEALEDGTIEEPGDYPSERPPTE